MEKESYVRMSYSETEEPHAPREAKLKEHWTRTLATEFFGTFISSVITCGVINSVYYNNIEAITKIQERALFPGSGIFAFPVQSLFISVGIGLAYTIGLMVAPESQLNPAFTFAMVLGGVKPLHLLLPSLVGQLFGNVFGALTIFACGHQYFAPNAAGGGPVFHKETNYFSTNFATLYGFSPPNDSITNGMVCWNSMIFTALIICVVIPAALKNPNQMPVVVGLVVTTFACAQAPFGVMLNPAMEFGGAIACTIIGFPAKEIWGAHEGYLWAALVGPFLGVILGVSMFRLYAFMVWEAPRK